jgi:3-oxoacyl-[acyl-carrier protein] reductase
MGRATAELFADEGARVAVTDLESESIARVVDRIREAGGDATGWPLDVSDSARIKTVVGEIGETLGPIDILVNNAGITIGGNLSQSDEEYEANWSRALDVMLTAQVRLARACLEQLTRRGGGRIINIASTEALGSSLGAGPYSVAKHGVVGLTRSMAVELGARGVTVNCICPGPILTAMTVDIPEQSRNKFARRKVPLRRYGEPEEVAHAILNFALPGASYLNGVVLPVDGGMTIQNS